MTAAERPPTHFLTRSGMNCLWKWLRWWTCECVQQRSVRPTGSSLLRYTEGAAVENHSEVLLEFGVAASVRWPSPPALQLSQPVLSALNMLRPHSLRCFHGSDVEVGVPNGVIFWGEGGMFGCHFTTSFNLLTDKFRETCICFLTLDSWFIRLDFCSGT